MLSNILLFISLAIANDYTCTKSNISRSAFGKTVTETGEFCFNSEKIFLFQDPANLKNVRRSQIKVSVLFLIYLASTENQDLFYVENWVENPIWFLFISIKRPIHSIAAYFLMAALWIQAFYYNTI